MASLQSASILPKATFPGNFQDSESMVERSYQWWDCLNHRAGLEHLQQHVHPANLLRSLVLCDRLSCETEKIGRTMRQVDANLQTMFPWNPSSHLLSDACQNQRRFGTAKKSFGVASLFRSIAVASSWTMVVSEEMFLPVCHRSMAHQTCERFCRKNQHGYLTALTLKLRNDYGYCLER